MTLLISHNNFPLKETPGFISLYSLNTLFPILIIVKQLSSLLLDSDIKSCSSYLYILTSNLSSLIFFQVLMY